MFSKVLFRFPLILISCYHLPIPMEHDNYFPEETFALGGYRPNKGISRALPRTIRVDETEDIPDGRANLKVTVILENGVARV